MDEPRQPSARGGRVVVVGSANTDLVLRVRRPPGVGETVLATAREDHAGGKGLNQAVACARAGAATTLVAALGTDDAGDALAGVVEATGIGAGRLRRSEQRTGTALIVVADDGDNSIIVDPGANATLTALVDGDRAAIAAAAVLVAQLEVPLDVVLAAAEDAAAAGTLVVLNAAPAAQLPERLLALVDVLVVNEHEAALLAGAGERSPRECAQRLLDVVPAVVVTLGAAGAIVAQRGRGLVSLPARRADVVDTTGAGDTAVGYLAAGLAAGDDLVTASVTAMVAGSLATEASGAVPSIPSASAVDAAIGATSAGV